MKRRVVVPHEGGDVGWSGGGMFAEFKPPHVRLFDVEKRRRKVRLRFSRFYGEAHHLYASLKEEDNPFWRPRSGRECPSRHSCHDDAEGRGKKLEKKFRTEVAAKNWVKAMVRKHFPKKTHVVQRDLAGECDLKNVKWIYKNGD